MWISRKNRLLDLLCIAALVLLAVAVAYPRWRAWVDWRDEGLLAYGTVRVINGEIPHRDFVSLQPPLSYYTTALAFKVGGTSLLSLRIFGLVVFFLLPLLIYAIGRNWMGPVLSLVSAAPVCVLGMPYMRFVPFAVWQGIAGSLLSVLLFVAAIRFGRVWIAFAAGMVSAISLFLRHDQALYTGLAIVTLALALHFARSQRGESDNEPAHKLNGFNPSSLRCLVLWFVGIATVCITLLIVWWSVGALPEMFRQLVVFPFATYRKTSALPFPKLFGQESFLDTATALLFYLPPMVQGIVAIYVAQSIIRRRFELPEAVLTFLLVWSALFYLQVLVRSDVTHILMTLPPFFLLAGFGWSMLREVIDHSRGIQNIVSAALLLLIASFLWILRPVALPDMSEQKELLNLPRGGVRVARAEAIQNFFEKLQQDVPANRSILILPYQPMFYFLSERRNPTHWNYLWPGDQTDSDHEKLVEQAEHDPPAMVLLAEQDELAKFAPTLVEYVREQYIYTDRIGDVGIYVRREIR